VLQNKGKGKGKSNFKGKGKSKGKSKFKGKGKNQGQDQVQGGSFFAGFKGVLFPYSFVNSLVVITTNLLLKFVFCFS